ncbi:DUF4173 domain-containing protein [Dyadobacter subterraneus]|uniref:DUF4173 domain-containing protein n=1 Tax=Dyadobacter subterraneus TaxID=2773304 RepID=A0ABR9W5E6_9BACT|nr:DUF4173 domain-containing protein [Dyadobacter subterraneus]MBE9460673.1 DUF4173 domain-containing protein [Dyadobacter subterraneus]
MSKIRTYLLWIALAVLHTYLFFDYGTGVNALLFSAVTVGIVTIYHRLANEKLWWMAACGHLIAALAVSLHSYPFSTAVYHLSFYVLAGYVVSSKSSLPIAFINSLYRSFFYSFIITVYGGFVDLVNAIFTSNKSHLAFRKTTLYIAPISVTAIFYLLYGAVNPDFFLSINFPEWEFDGGWIAYTLFGCIIICPLFFPGKPGPLVAWDSSKPNLLERHQGKLQGKKFTIMGLFYENKQGVIMFIMLNTLIAVFLGFNILQIFFPSLNHHPIGHSDQVHQGFEVLILSIAAAIVLIMYYFRENQNFYEKKDKLVKLATIWIILNGLLILFTCYKNILYVDAFGLTYKRIFVFIGMLLSGIGLYLTIIKIYKVKTNWYLLRQNTWVIYFVITSFGLVDWDRLITWYNPNYAQYLDVRYILGLGDTQIPYLSELLEANDPRIIPYKADVENKIINLRTPTSWQAETADAMWLRKYKR